MILMWGLSPPVLSSLFPIAGEDLRQLRGVAAEEKEHQRREGGWGPKANELDLLLVGLEEILAYIHMWQICGNYGQLWSSIWAGDVQLAVSL